MKIIKWFKNRIIETLSEPTDHHLTLPASTSAKLKEAKTTWHEAKQAILSNPRLDPIRQSHDMAAIDSFQETLSIDDDALIYDSLSSNWEYCAEAYTYAHRGSYSKVEPGRVLALLIVIASRLVIHPVKDKAKSAEVLAPTPASSDELTMGDVPSSGPEGRSAYRPVNVSNNYHKGFLYYPVEVVEVKKEYSKSQGGHCTLEKRTTIVVRSDGTTHTAHPSDLPADSVTGERIYRLTDGTLIQHPPKASDYSTWEWESIQSFVDGNSETPDLSVLLKQLHSHMHHRIWLPTEEDYWILALAAAASYCQSIFDAVPLILLTGPAGTGKSELSAAMSETSANAVMISQGSAATLMRLVDESGGLVVVDDLESVGNKKGQERFNEIAQVLKVSYKKGSATRVITDRKSGRTMIMNFFGIKIISNTLGVDKILGSRMLHVHTRAMPEYEKENFHARTKFPVEEQRVLRNNLHTWAFENVRQIEDTYLSMYKDKTNRDDEIAAPLRVLAEMSGDANIIASIERAFEAQSNRRKNKDDPEALMDSALRHLVLEGYRGVTPQHIVLEMRRQLDPGHVIEQGVDVPAWARPEWVGRRLREGGFVKEGEGVRKRLHGIQLRILDLSKDFITKTISTKPYAQQAERDSLSFCGSCEGCPYRPYQCEIAAKRYRASAA
jgi:hypothetical protein